MTSSCQKKGHAIVELTADYHARIWLSVTYFTFREWLKSETIAYWAGRRSGSLSGGTHPEATLGILGSDRNDPKRSVG